MNFVFCGKYVRGQYSLIGYLEDGEEMLFQNELIFTGNSNQKSYIKIMKKVNKGE